MSQESMFFDTELWIIITFFSIVGTSSSVYTESCYQTNIQYWMKQV